MPIGLMKGYSGKQVAGAGGYWLCVYLNSILAIIPLSS
jgi:hypothetical protein